MSSIPCPCLCLCLCLCMCPCLLFLLLSSPFPFQFHFPPSLILPRIYSALGSSFIFNLPSDYHPITPITIPRVSPLLFVFVFVFKRSMFVKGNRGLCTLLPGIGLELNSTQVQSKQIQFNASEARQAKLFKPSPSPSPAHGNENGLGSLMLYLLYWDVDGIDLRWFGMR